MKVLFELWKDGLDFFFATNWSGWSKLDRLEEKYSFNRKIIWITRYFVSVPILLGNSIVAIIWLKNKYAAAPQEPFSTTGIQIFIWSAVVLAFVIYPTAMLAIYLRAGLIRRK